MLLVSAAIAGVNRTGQEILSRSPFPGVRAALASSPDTAESVLDRLARDRAPEVRRYALRRTTAVDVLSTTLAPGRRGLLTAAAAANPLAPEHLLIEALASTDRAVRLAAWCNSSTPLAQRMTLDAATADELVCVGGSLADQVVRAHSLALANPWLSDTPKKWGGVLRRALAALPGLTREQVAELRSVSSHGRAALAAHPVMLQGGIPDLGDLSTRIGLGSPAVDLLTLGAEEVSCGDAALLLQRVEPEPEPIVIAAAVRRFGPKVLIDVIRSGAVTKWSSTRVSAAAWSEPVIGFVKNNDDQNLPAFQRSSEILGTSPQAWETFVSLLPSWHNLIEDAAQAAASI